MRLTLGILGVFFTVVVAPPPLDVELRAEKEYLEKLKYDQEDTLDTFGDNLIPDTEEKAIEDTDAEYPVVLKHDEAEFVPIAFSNKFDKYDENNDDFIDEGELITVIGVSENIALALKDADNDGDGLLSRDEFENGPWDLDAADLPDVESIDDLGDENEDLIDKEFIDYDSDTFNDILEADDGMIDADNEIIDDFIETGDDFKEKMEDLHEEMNKDGENDVTEKAKEIVGDLKENINDVQEKVNEIHEDMVEKVGN